jgi:hypothetical protein
MVQAGEQGWHLRRDFNPNLADGGSEGEADRNVTKRDMKQ